jgi:hypothetical protein
LRRGLGGISKAGERRRQFDERLEVEPVPDVLRIAPAGNGPESFSALAAKGSGKIAGTAISSGGVTGDPTQDERLR